MPSHGSLVLSDLAAHYLTLVRESCGRRGRLNVAQHPRMKPRIANRHRSLDGDARIVGGQIPTDLVA
jgi:hypothetical protein